MKKVLIITYYWPPAGGPGVQRITKYVKYLPEFGWQPIILTVNNPTSPARDESLLKDIPKICTVYKTKAWEPFNLYRFFTGKKKHENLAKDIIIKKPDEKISEKISRIIRANLFIPDARVGWIPLMVKEGKKIIKKENPRVIFSTSPPHSLQLGAKRLAQKSGIKWIADFRDPWIEAYWESEIERINLIRRLNEKLERDVLKRADVTTTVSDGFVDLFSTKASNKYAVLYHGFETLNSRKLQTEKFIIMYIGNMSKYQSPLPLFQAIMQQSNNIRNKIELVFIGRIYNDFKKLYNQFRDIHVTVKDYMPYHDVMENCLRASLLLLINPQPIYGPALLPVKIYDYISLRKPIIALGNKGGKLELILNETKSGRLFNQDEIDHMSEFIKFNFENWERNKYILLTENSMLNKYSVKSNVQKLVDLFEN